MKIAVISEWFSENMGYAENMLPKALVSLGHEVDVISSTAQVYFNSPTYAETYQPFLGSRIQPEGIKKVENFQLHRLPLARMEGMPGITGLQKYLEDLKPEVIQTFDVYSESTYDSAVAARNLSAKLFTASHLHASVFKKKKRSWKRRLFNLVFPDENTRRLEFISDQTICCYPIAPDAARVVKKHYGVPDRKIKVQSLGVDTELFYPNPSNQDRSSMRAEFGIDDQDILCIYTGRFARDKNPQCLAQAIDLLQQRGERVFCLFVGNGTEEERKEISNQRGCFLKDFVLVHELNRFYWMADIGVWPAQESTSQLDAMACGLPLILSDQIEVLERIDGNGFRYRQGDCPDLAEKIVALKNPDLRKTFSEAGIQKVKNLFSWNAIARSRAADYERLILK
jgi:glycosyltransferase involved in cell wall biosynthesis